MQICAPLVWLLSLVAPAFADGFDDVGPLFDRFELTLAPGHRTEAVGPLFYRQAEEDGTTIAVPPLFSYTHMTATDSAEFDIAYPLLSYDRFGTEYRFHIGQLFSFAGGQTQAEDDVRRFTLFPFYFQQRSADTNKNYTALFPIYGHMQNRLFRSEIDFALWPLYVKTVRRKSASPLPDDPFEKLTYRFLSARRGDVTTYNMPFPIFHLRYGEGLRGWQFLPIAGHEKKDIVQKTNTWGDVESIPGYEKNFILWPLWYDQHREIGTDNPEHAQGLLPFYTFLRSPKRDSTTYLWPLGLTITDDRTRGYHEVDAPWPFVVFARGEKTANRIWPLYGNVYTTNLQSSFFLWPLYKYNRIKSEPLDRYRARVMLFLYSQSQELNMESGKSKERRDFWPLYTWKKDFNGSTRFQMLSVLEPILPQSKSIERNYSPVWSLWRSEHNTANGASSQSLLWNLYRHESKPDSAKCSFLFGLFQCEAKPDSHRWRICYIPFDTHKTRTNNPVP